MLTEFKLLVIVLVVLNKVNSEPAVESHRTNYILKCEESQAEGKQCHILVESEGKVSLLFNVVSLIKRLIFLKFRMKNEVRENSLRDCSTVCCRLYLTKRTM